MPMASNSANAYKQQQILTASPEQLILMLYNGCIKFINEAVAGIEEKNIEKTHNSCIRAQNIVSELMHTLNMDYPISAELFRLYEYVEYELVHGNMEKNKERFNNGKRVITELREGWAEAMKKVREEGGVASAKHVAGDSVISV